jgi:hypothetical protein
MELDVLSVQNPARNDIVGSRFASDRAFEDPPADNSLEQLDRRS